jgi:hypothetical protein
MATLYDENNPPPTVEERYSTSVTASNLRIDTREGARGAGDMMIAAMMNPFRMGLALTRLASEWDRSAKPRPLSPAAVELLAKSIEVEPATIYVHDPEAPDIRIRPNPNAGLVREFVGGEVRYRTPIVVANEQAQAWHAHELGLLFQRLKTLPTVRAGLVAEFRRRAQGSWHAPQVYPWERVDAVPHIVAAVLEWWLHKTCPACQGVKFKVVQGTRRTSNMACTKCKGSGELKIPHGHLGRRVVSYINACRAEAIGDLKGRFRHQQRQEKT